MIGYYPQKRLMDCNEVGQPAYLALFVGGFGDFCSGMMHRVWKDFDGFFPGIPYVKSYYHWDGGALGLMLDRHQIIARDIALSESVWGNVPVVLVGHSYGASAAMEALRLIDHARGRRDLIVLTVDAVSRRQPKTRAEGVLFWGNSYLREGTDLLDWVARAGGRWGETPDADIDLVFSGRDESSPGVRYSHRNPGPMFYDGPGREGEGLFGHAAAVLRERI